MIVSDSWELLYLTVGMIVSDSWNDFIWQLELFYLTVGMTVSDNLDIGIQQLGWLYPTQHWAIDPIGHRYIIT